MRNNWFAILLIGLCLLHQPTIVNATQKENTGLRFTYENILPKNQIGDNTYFELKVKPGDEQELKTKIINHVDEELTVKININDATTSSTGVINYGPSKESLLKEESVSIKEILEGPDKIKLKPFETKEITFKLKVPNKNFEGIVLGGIQLKEMKEDKKETSEEKFSLLENEYAYLYSISLIENNKKPEFNFTSGGVDYTDEGAVIKMNNLAPVIVSNMAVDTLLMGSDNDEILDEFNVKNYRMAPNSVLKLPLLGTDHLEPGTYRTKTKVKIKDKEWSFDDEFVVEKKMNQEEVEQAFEEENNPFFLIIILASFVLIVSVSYYLLTKKFVKTKKRRRK